jgi:hypothetical protein
MAAGVMTQRWGWQPTAWMQAGLPAWSWRGAPAGLVTRRQMRAAGLAPGGAAPVGLVVCRQGRRWAHLWDERELAPKRVPSPAQLAALERALAARRWCPSCRRHVGYCVPLSLGRCVDGAFPAPADVRELDELAGDEAMAVAA